MGKDPLFRQTEDETERLVAEKAVMTLATDIVFLKALSGFLALALISVIWLVWGAQHAPLSATEHSDLESIPDA
jgi:hypothetical protein